MQDKINLIKETLKEDLEVSGWHKILSPFLDSEGFDNITDTLTRLVDQDRRFTPKLKDAFNAFKETKLSDVKVVIVGQDPYPQLGVADGIAFSCGNTLEMQPTLKHMLNAVNRTVYDGVGQSHNPDLTRWSNQGVLMLNTALTTTVSKMGQHFAIWKPFLAYLFDYLTFGHTGLVYIYMGKQAQEWKDVVHDMNYKFILDHPISAEYNKDSKWNCEDIFVKVQKILKDNNNYSLIW